VVAQDSAQTRVTAGKRVFDELGWVIYRTNIIELLIHLQIFYTIIIGVLGFWGFGVLGLGFRV
jgi:hypothetical protein